MLVFSQSFKYIFAYAKKYISNFMFNYDDHMNIKICSPKVTFKRLQKWIC